MDGLHIGSVQDLGGVTGEPGASGLSALAAAARGGDRAAADRLYETARPMLLRQALALGAHSDAAADLVQDTLWAAHRNLARFDPSRGTAEGWLATILIRRLKNLRRSRARRTRLLDALRWHRGAGTRAAPATSDPTAAAVEARLTLRRLLAGLTDRQREVVALYEIAELDADETARILGIGAAGVRSIARDARRRLSEAARGGDDAPPSTEESP